MNTFEHDGSLRKDLQRLAKVYYETRDYAQNDCDA